MQPQHSTDPTKPMMFSLMIIILTGLSLTLTPLHTSADDTAKNAVVGLWATATSILHISQQGEQLSARVFALLEPNYTDGEAFGPPGDPRLDDNNPEASLRKRPIKNLELLSGYQFTGKRWEGKIYDPESGNTYSSRMEVDSQGKLRMRGFIGISLLGRTEVLEPLKTCTPTMQAMLRNSNIKTTPGCGVTPP